MNLFAGIGDLGMALNSIAGYVLQVTCKQVWVQQRFVQEASKLLSKETLLDPTLPVKLVSSILLHNMYFSFTDTILRDYVDSNHCYRCLFYLQITDLLKILHLVRPKVYYCFRILSI